MPLSRKPGKHGGVKKARKAKKVSFAKKSKKHDGKGTVKKSLSTFFKSLLTAPFDLAKEVFKKSHKPADLKNVNRKKILTDKKVGKQAMESRKEAVTEKALVYILHDLKLKYHRSKSGSKGKQQVAHSVQKAWEQVVHRFPGIMTAANPSSILCDRRPFQHVCDAFLDKAQQAGWKGFIQYDPAWFDTNNKRPNFEK